MPTTRVPRGTPAPAGPLPTYDMDQFDDSLDMDKIQRESAFTPYWNPKEGTSRIRMLPIPSERSFFLKASVHYNLGADGRGRLHCATEHDNSACVACELYDELIGSDKEPDQDLASDIRAKVQYYTPLIDMREPEKGVQIYQYGPMVMRGIRAIIDDARTWGNPFSVKNGREWQLTKTKKGGEARNVEYAIIAMPNITTLVYDGPLGDDIERKVRSLISYVDVDRQRQVVRGTRPTRNQALTDVKDIPFGDEDMPPTSSMPKANRDAGTVARPARTSPAAVAVAAMEPEEVAPRKVKVATGRTQPVAHEARFCGNCGTAGSGKFCSKCGLSLTEPEDLLADDIPDDQAIAEKGEVITDEEDEEDVADEEEAETVAAGVQPANAQRLAGMRRRLARA